MAKKEGNEKRPTQPQQQKEWPFHWLGAVALIGIWAAHSLGVHVGEKYLVQMRRPHLTLPAPKLPDGKSFPNYLYSGKSFGESFSKRNVDVHLNGRSHEEVSEWIDTGAAADLTVHHDAGEMFQPMGQHLLIDMKHVAPDFLGSVERLAESMLSLVSQSYLTLLSYHCHDLDTGGVSCVGILLESHVSLHTWPDDGVILLDLFTCGPKSLLPLLPVIKSLFAIGSDASDAAPSTRWSYKKRGYNYLEDGINPESAEFEVWFAGSMHVKRKDVILSDRETDFQSVAIYEKVRHGDDSREFEAFLEKSNQQNLASTTPDRTVYLDEVMQSNRFGLEAYHEALVHPAMFAHPNPKRVAIIGGGEGATLREVLKHNTVETCVMIEIDEDLVDLSTEYLTEWNNCSDLVDSAPSCFDDERAEVHFTDAYQWFLDRYLDFDSIALEDKFDVLIMDALDPSAFVDFSDILYGSRDFARALTNALSDDGVLVAQVGLGTHLEDPGAYLIRNGQARKKFIKLLEENHMYHTTSYSEAHGRFMEPWEFLVAFVGEGSMANWYREVPFFELEIQQRAWPTLSGQSSFMYFDGATMMEYQFPSRGLEEVYCRDISSSDFCKGKHGFDLESPNLPANALEVRTSETEGAGRGVFVTKSFPKGAHVAIDEAVHSMMIPHKSYGLIENMRLGTAAGSIWEVIKYYCTGYGFANEFFGETSVVADPGLLTFVNHGCDSSYNIGTALDVTERTADLNSIPPNLDKNPYEDFFYDFYVLRNHLLFLTTGDRLRQDVSEGTELLDNYLTFFTQEDWAQGVASLHSMCSKIAPGIVSKYESSKK